MFLFITEGTIPKQNTSKPNSAIYRLIFYDQAVSISKTLN